MNNLENVLCKKYNKKYGVFTGNGTTALFLALQALNMQDKRIIFPAISCTNPVNAAIFAGYDVDFCDITMENYTIDITKLEKMLDTNLHGIVVPTHIYGHQCDMDKINALCSDKNVIVVEDAAQTYKVMESTVSIVSFGHTKIFETESGGGIAFTNVESIYNQMKKYQHMLNKCPSNSDELFDIYRKKYYEIVKNARNEYDKCKKLKQLQLDSRDTFIFDLNENDEIPVMLNKEKSIFKDRIFKKKLYDEFLNKDYVEIPKQTEEILWRYTFVYKGNRERLLYDARKEGIDISSWYPSLSMIYNNKLLENADILQKSVINLWITEDHNEDRIKRDIAILNRLMEEDMNE